MTPTEQRGDLDRLLTLLVEADIAIVSKPVVIVASGRSTKRVTWRASSGESGDLYRAPYATIDEYVQWIGAEAYSAVLFDGALLQLSFEYSGSQLTGHRLVYFPSPYAIDPELLKEGPLLDVVDLYVNSHQQRPRLVSPLRFDYDSGYARNGHPASHLTTISAQCRWAVTTPLSSGHFTRFVFRHFYPELYQLQRFLQAWPQQYENRTITGAEEMLLHISSRRPPQSESGELSRSAVRSASRRRRIA